MGTLTEYFAGISSRPSNDELTATLKQYPWFMTARILLSENQGDRDKLLALHKLSHPLINKSKTTEIFSDETISAGEDEKITATVLADEQATEKDSIIEAFLSKGEYRIVPDESTQEFDAAKDSAKFEADDELASEELAEIYLAQGLNEQAKVIYERLCLLNPEKSVYFAEIIGKIDSGNDVKII